MHTYRSGNEYEDIAAAWDWNLIPGITTDYGATTLSCSTTSQTGKRTFVGGASNGKIGVAAMDYVNPLTGSLAYRKAWFFFEDDVQHVTISGINSTTAADVVSVLDQKRAQGPMYVDGEVMTMLRGRRRDIAAAKSLWHDQIGYQFDRPASSSVEAGDVTGPSLSAAVVTRSGNWSTIGTSVIPGKEVEMFTAWLGHGPGNLPSASYSVYPGTSSPEVFAAKAKGRRITTTRNDAVAAAAVDGESGVVMVVFWKPEGGAVDLPGVSIESKQGAIVIFDTKSGVATAADPTQMLTTIHLGFVRRSEGIGSEDHVKTVNVALKQGGEAGRSVTVRLEGW